MSKQILFSVIKITTSKINRKIVKTKNDEGKRIPKIPIEYNLGNYSYENALNNNEIVSIGDNLVLYKIREYYGCKTAPGEIYDEIQSIKNDIFDLKEQENSDESKNKLFALNEKLKNIIFVKDIVNVRVQNKEHYKDIALNYFWMNGIKYKRLCAGSGQLRRNTITFVNEKLYDYLLESLMCGLNGKIEKITLAKLSAYFALSFSSMLWVRKPRICVIPDIKTTLNKQKLDFIFTDENGEKKVEEREIDITLNSCDGEGLISPECAKWFSEDIGLDYTACQFILRSAFVKGLLVTFDFKVYAKEKYEKNKIKSIYGEEFNIDEIDVLLTESMFKMNKFYTSVKEYVDFHDKYNLMWGVTRCNKKYDDDYSLLNYQYIQNNNLQVNDLDKLIQPTLDWFEKICGGNKLYSLLYAIGCHNKNDKFEDIEENCGSVYTKAIVKNSNLLNDTFIKNKIYQSIKESFRLAKIGRIWVKGCYQFMISDPIPLLQNALGVESIGLIPEKQIYSKYWNEYNPKEIDLCRSPMVDRHEHNIVSLAKSTEMDKWYKYLYSGIIYSIYDMGTIIASDADFDGDLIFSTDSKILINGAFRNNNPITYNKANAPEQNVNYKNIVLCDLNGLDTLVGEITNKSTSITAMLPIFPVDKYPEEHNELINRLKLLREIIGAEIDKIKLGVAPEFPQHWIKKVTINELDSDIEKAIKYQHNSLVINKKAYFMIYIYDNLKRAYSNHVKQFNLDCRNKFRMSYLDLKYKKDKNEDEYRFLNRFEYFSPVLDTNCIMNILCHKIEEFEDGIKYNKDSISVLHEFNEHLYQIHNNKLDSVKLIYKKYKAQKKFTYYKNILEDLFVKDNIFEYLSNLKKSLIADFKQQCYSLISTNTKELFEYMITLAEHIESDKVNFDYSFIWDILGYDILVVIPKKDSLICVEDDDGQEYLGRKYKLIEVVE